MEFQRGEKETKGGKEGGEEAHLVTKLMVGFLLTKDSLVMNSYCNEQGEKVMRLQAIKTNNRRKERITKAWSAKRRVSPFLLPRE